MLTTTLRAMTLFTLLTLPQAVLAGSMTYDIVNYPDLQNGWTLSGTITTDGTIGTIQASDITSWTWTIVEAGTALTIRSTDLGAGVTVDGLTATSTDLQLHFNSDQLLQLGSNAAFLQDATSHIEPRFITQALGPAIPPPRIAWSSSIPQPPGTSAWLIASTSTAAVPEPCTL